VARRFFHPDPLAKKGPQMAYMPREPAPFTSRVADLLLELDPKLEIRVSGPLQLVINKKHLNLDNLQRMIVCEPERGEEIAREFLRRLVESNQSSALLPFSVVEPRIMPRIQPIAIFEELDRSQVAHQDFVNGTVVVYVLDLPQITVSISVEQVVRWDVPIEEIDKLARENLVRYTSELEVQLVSNSEGGMAAIIAKQDGYDAARLVLENLHERLAPELGDDFYVATPARDLLLAFSLGPDEFVERLSDRVREDFNRLPYPISPDLFIVTRDGIAGTYIE
jgi:uncharacterized protein YtpQ (UPF0354 family)